MKLVVGLGNPGNRYENTRHNVGFVVVDELSKKMINDQWQMDNKLNALIINHHPLFVLAKPQAFMNNSGKVVSAFVRFYKLLIPDVWVIHDDLDIKLGDWKIEIGHGPKLHNGINSIEKNLGSENFWRVRVGVENRNPDMRIPGEDYVLMPFAEEEKSAIEKVTEAVAQELIKYLKK